MSTDTHLFSPPPLSLSLSPSLSLFPYLSPPLSLSLSLSLPPSLSLQAHCYYVVLKAFSAAIETKGLSSPNEAIMRKLCSLFAMHGIVQKSGEFMTVRGKGKERVRV